MSTIGCIHWPCRHGGERDSAAQIGGKLSPASEQQDKKDCFHVHIVFGGDIQRPGWSAEVTELPRRGDVIEQAEPSSPRKRLLVALFQGVCLVPVFLTDTCVCAWENSVENLQNSMDECQMRWNVSDVCERTGSLGKLRRPSASRRAMTNISPCQSVDIRSRVIFLLSFSIRCQLMVQTGRKPSLKAKLTSVAQVC